MTRRQARPTSKQAQAPREWDQFGGIYDHPTFSGRARRYLLASVPRSGSHYLGHLLTATRLLGSPLEYFHPRHVQVWNERFDTGDVCAMLDKLATIRTSPNGWFGVKAHWHQLAPLLADQRSTRAVDFDRYVYVRRRDVVSQAISLVLARESGAWISFHTARNTAECRYSRSGIDLAIAEIREQEARWQAFFSDRGAIPFTVDYEDLVMSPTTAVREVCKHMDVDVTTLGNDDNVPLPYRQASERNDVWRRRYLAESQG